MMACRQRGARPIGSRVQYGEREIDEQFTNRQVISSGNQTA
jgi:hypothetical protein